MNVDTSQSIPSSSRGWRQRCGCRPAAVDCRRLHRSFCPHAAASAGDNDDDDNEGNEPSPRAGTDTNAYGGGLQQPDGRHASAQLFDPMIPGPRCHPRCHPPPSTTPSSAVDPAIVVTNVFDRRRQRRHCFPSTSTLSSSRFLLPRSGCCRCHDHCFCHHRCRFLVDCGLWTLPGALSPAPPPSFITSFDDVILPPWALALDDAESRGANARRSLGCRRPPPSASVPRMIGGGGNDGRLLAAGRQPHRRHWPREEGRQKNRVCYLHFIALL